MRRNLLILALISAVIGSAATKAFAAPDSICYSPSGRAVDCKILKEAKRLVALKHLIEKNKELKAELSSYRKAELLDSAKGSELPKTAVLAADTTVKIPAATASTVTTASAVAAPTTSTVSVPVTPTSTVQTTVATEQPSGFEKDFSAAFEDSTAKPFSDSSGTLYNSFKFIFKYNITDNINVKSEPGFDWQWKNNPNVLFKDLPFALNHGCLYYASNKIMDFNLSGSFVVSLPTSKGSQKAGVLSYIISNVVGKVGFDNNDGSLTITPEIAYAIRKYATSQPTATDQASFDSLADGQIQSFGDDVHQYEKLNPYDQYTVSLNTSFWHKIAGIFSFATWVKIIDTKMYGDYVSVGGVTRTITPESWNNNIEFSQELKFKFNDRLVLKTGIASTGALNGFKPFSASGTNNVTWWVSVKYDFFNITDPF